MFSEEQLFTQSGELVEVIQLGEHNLHAGPDFLNARIRIGPTIWVGNIEIHIHSSDWYHHGHHHDKAYDNVIMQVVLNHNQQVRRSNREIIPTVELQFDSNLFLHYQQLLENESWIPCEKEIEGVDRSIIDFWLSSLTIERLEIKSLEIEDNLRENQNHWETTFYHKLARNFGFKVNGEPFELLARSLPLQHIGRHKDNLLQLEALFFGQAGFLGQKRLDDGYHSQLFDEYTYLRNKFQLKPLAKHIWRFAKLRPVNFPTIRIAQFCILLHQSSRLFSEILEKKSLEALKRSFAVRPSPYWDTHYSFHRPGVYKPKRLGEEAFQILVINTVVPFLFVYGKAQNIPAYKERALDFLLEMQPENNSIIRGWADLGIKAPNAYHSQALLQLKHAYCDNHRCLDCQIGNNILNHPKSEGFPI